MLENLVDILYDVGSDLVKMNIPPYLTNGLMTLSKYKKKCHPIDFNKEFRGKPILGLHKTYEGLIIGVGSGSAGGIALSYLLGPTYAIYSVGSSFITAASDMLGSIIKRRRGKPSGSDVPYIDRTVWLLFYPLFYNLLFPSDNFPLTYISSFVIGYGLHNLTNRLKNRFFKSKNKDRIF